MLQKEHAELERKYERANKTLEEVMKVCQEHCEKQSIHHSYNSIPDRVATVIREYEDIAGEALRASKGFRDRMATYFQSFGMVLAMVASASTHREKDARIRGCIELVETAIRKLEEERFDLSLCDRPRFDFAYLMRCDFPTRQFVERIHELEEQVKALQNPEPNNEKPSGDVAF